MVHQGLFIWSIFSTWQADNHRHMFRLSDSKMYLEFPSGQPLVSSPAVASSKFLYTVWYLILYVWHDYWIHVSIQFGAILDQISSFEAWEIPINGDKWLSQNAFIIWCINPYNESILWQSFVSINRNFPSFKRRYLIQNSTKLYRNMYPIIVPYI